MQGGGSSMKNACFSLWKSKSYFLTTPKGRKKLHKVLESIGRIREKHRSISGCYEINAIPSDDGLIAIRIEWKVLSEKIEDKLTGSYYLRTNLL